MFPLKNTEAYIHANGYRSTLGKELAARDADISEVKSEIQALTNKLEDEAETRAALGAHNFLKTTISSQTKNGITLTVNSDKSITVSTEAGGATETTVFNVCEGYSLKAGTYIYSGVPATGSSETTYYLDMRTDTSSQFIIDSSRPEREITTVGQSGNDARLIIMSGVVITTPITFKPMIRLATDVDDTYQPYAKTNVELTQDVAGLGTRSGVTTGSASVPNNAWTNIASVTVPTGPCLLHARVNLLTEPTAFEIALSISSSSTSSSTARNRILTGVSSTITDTAIGDFLYLNNSSETTEYLWFKHNKGDAITVYPTFEVIQL